MSEVNPPSPSSTADHDSGTAAKNSAFKDRACPYCNTYFTSSSLGRHLDLYIKERNPKPPDGVHDVDEIRKTRGGITRRQARTSSVKRQGSTPLSVNASLDRQSPSIAKGYLHSEDGDGAPVAIRLNHPNWQSTGVINNLPPTPRQIGARYDPRRDFQRSSIKEDLVKKQRQVEERDKGKAAELALREVLDSLRAAKSRAHPPPPFPFDWFVYNFPALCLRLLSRPPSISSTLPTSTGQSWPIRPPDTQHLDILRQRLEWRLSYWRKEVMNRWANEASANGDKSDVHIPAIEDDKPYYEHLQSTYDQWMALPEHERHETWTLEALRAFAREEKDHGDTHIKVVNLEQEVRNLKSQVDRLSKCQMPREFLLNPPTTMTISEETLKELLSHQKDEGADHWDADRLMEKWKLRIQADRNRQKALPQSADGASPSTTTPSFSIYGAQGVGNHSNSNSNAPPQFRSSKSMTITGNGDSTYGMASGDGGDGGDGGSGGQSNGLPSEERDHHQISDSDLIDAPGDEDDDMAEAERDDNMARVLDPKFRTNGGSEVMQGLQRTRDPPP
ncbi:hypothetical protein MMC25_003397 [Agyrium rufum]|nr:hypothetical protein [Agyrium rufum]